MINVILTVLQAMPMRIAGAFFLKKKILENKGFVVLLEFFCLLGPH
jgi:hypothetical protein